MPFDPRGIITSSTTIPTYSPDSASATPVSPSGTAVAPETLAFEVFRQHLAQPMSSSTTRTRVIVVNHFVRRSRGPS